jgi:hypothetical protein
LVFQILPPYPNFISFLLHWKNFLMETLMAFYLLNFPTFYAFRNSRSLVFRFLPLNLNFISLLDWKHFFKENSITLCLLNFPTLDAFRNFRSLVFWILPPNPNFTSLLNWKKFS